MNFPSATITYPEVDPVIPPIKGGGVTTMGSNPNVRVSIFEYDPISRRMRLRDTLRGATIEEVRDGYEISGRSLALHRIADDGGQVTIHVKPDPRCKGCMA